MNLLASNQIFLIEVIVAVVEIIGAVILFALLAYIMARNKKFVDNDNDTENSEKGEGKPEIRYVYISSAPPGEGVVASSAPASVPPAPTDLSVAAPAPTPVPTPASEPIRKDLDMDEDDEEESDTDVEVRVEGQYAHYIYTKYNRSMTAKLAMGSNTVKRYYSDIKNALLSYNGVKSRLSWKWEMFRIGKKTVARLKFSGKSLALCLALYPQQFEGSKYTVRDMSSTTTYADTPTMYKIKTARQLQYAFELIDIMMSAEGVSKIQYPETVDYAADFPAEDRDSLRQRNLVKVTVKEEIREITPEQQSGYDTKPVQCISADAQS